MNQQDYYYCVKACDSANNCSAPSSTSSGFPDGKFTSSPVLTDGPKVDQITTRSARITWQTDRDSDSKVAFGISGGNYFAEEPSIAEQVVSHEINLNTLSPGTTYYYQAKWTDEDGNTGVSVEKAFTTLPAPVIQNVSVLSIGLDSALVQF